MCFSCVCGCFVLLYFFGCDVTYYWGVKGGGGGLCFWRSAEEEDDREDREEGRVVDGERKEHEAG